MQYNHKKIEDKWNRLWLKNGIYEPNFKKAKKSFYNLMMFPYPSAEGLHIGAVRTFSGVDIYGRMKRMQGYDVFEPIGLDGFGIHSENYALKIGKHPIQHAKDSEKNFYRQLAMMGNGFSWNEKLETYDPKYYKWTQWIFVQLFKRGLAYRKKSPVNWCPSCLTVLADEQVISGDCERCGTKVIKKDLEQWFFKITNYAERLLKNLEKLDWSEPVKIAQKNWIGKSEGALIRFPLSGLKTSNESLKFDLPKIPGIFSGEKFITVRLQPKNLKMGDFCELIDSTSGKRFGTALITAVEKQKLKDIPERGRGLQQFKSRKEFYKILAGYYKKMKVGDTTDAWLYHFRLVNEYIEVFTTRPDTLFGATYFVLAPEHQLISKIKNQISNIKEVEKYIKVARTKTDEERIAEGKEKTGVELKGIKVVNPANNEEIPIWVADYVLGNVGTGAIMAVPAHDQRDFEFAKKFNLPIKMVICPHYPAKTCPVLDTAYLGFGHLVASEKFDGMDSEKAKWEITKFVGGQVKTNYRLRDWLVSRQRYWGPPIPIIYCRKCWESAKRKAQSAKLRYGIDYTVFEDKEYIIHAVPEKDLPVKLPNIKNFRPTGTGTGPLGSVKSFYEVRCPNCGEKARRETDVSDAFLDSSWYYLRYPSVKDSRHPWDSVLTKKWLPVNMYIGGAEHSVLHLLYSRFIAMAFHDFQMLRFEEPFKVFRAHGLITKNGAKMSKSKGNVVNPDEYFKVYGADVMRMYLAFMAPLYQGGDFRDEGIAGITRFLNRVWRLVIETKDKRQKTKAAFSVGHSSLVRFIHKTIKKVTEDIENLEYNTAISALMTLLNKFETDPHGVAVDDLRIFLKLLSPFAPYMSEELYQQFFAGQMSKFAPPANSRALPVKSQAIGFRLKGQKFKSIHLESWPEYDPKLVEEETATIIIQINGKMRDKFEAKKDLPESELQKLVFGREKIKNIVGDKAKIKKFIYVKNRLVNIVF